MGTLVPEVDARSPGVRTLEVPGGPDPLGPPPHVLNTFSESARTRQEKLWTFRLFFGAK